LDYDQSDMTDDYDPTLETDAEPLVPRPVSMPRIPEERAPLISNRFLFVDVAAQRAKQLRRGALPRLDALRPHPETGERPAVTARLERIAMEEVEEGLVVYELPEDRPDEATS
jgi:DNA-directed RNA polymerase subunit K/omega